MEKYTKISDYQREKWKIYQQELINVKNEGRNKYHNCQYKINGKTTKCGFV